LIRAENACLGDVSHLVLVGVDVGADDFEVGRTGGDRRDRFVAGVVEAVGDEVGEELLVPLLVSRDVGNETRQHRLFDPGRQVVAVHGVRALEVSHEHQGFHLGVVVGAIPLQ
jgi:hypothetical protein